MTHANIDQALSLVAQHFKGMTDKDGEPYVMHCLRVMMGVEDPQAQLVGLMHDLVEDTPVTIENLRDQGFAPEVVDAVELVTHPEHLSYAEYVIRLKPNPIARQAKLSDLRDNCSMSRVLYREDRRDGDSARIQRYVLTYQFLSDRIDEATYRRLMQPLEE
ncbi:MAG: HD domain-containing protein [Planctomycetota bacterium]